MSEKYWRAEPLRRKLRRWLLGERNLPPQSFKEQEVAREVADRFTAAEAAEVSREFLRFDNAFFFGVGYRFVKRAYKSMGIALDEKKKMDLYKKSGYMRKLNQCSSSMTLSDFCAELVERFDDLQKGEQSDKYASFGQFVQDFLAAAEANKRKVG